MDYKKKKYLIGKTGYRFSANRPTIRTIIKNSICKALDDAGVEYILESDDLYWTARLTIRGITLDCGGSDKGSVEFLDTIRVRNKIGNPYQYYDVDSDESIKNRFYFKKGEEYTGKRIVSIINRLVDNQQARIDEKAEQERKNNKAAQVAAVVKKHLEDNGFSGLKVEGDAWARVVIKPEHDDHHTPDFALTLDADFKKVHCVIIPKLVTHDEQIVKDLYEKTMFLTRLNKSIKEINNLLTEIKL